MVDYLKWIERPESIREGRGFDSHPACPELDDSEGKIILFRYSPQSPNRGFFYADKHKKGPAKPALKLESSWLLKY